MGAVRDEDPDRYLIPLSVDGTEVVSVDTSARSRGWAAYFAPPVAVAGAEVLLRLSVRGTPKRPKPDPPSQAGTVIEVREVRVIVASGKSGFTSSLLREIPTLRIEAAVNQNVHRQRLAEQLAQVRTAAEAVHGGHLFRIRPGALPVVPERGLDLQDPGGYRKPDEFYRSVADLYLHLAAVSGRPAQELAQANKVPVATVHRWIREAKVRGLLLLPAHRGSAGAARPPT